MFLAYLSIAPSIAAFLLPRETRFYEKYLRSYREIENQATYGRIEENHATLIGELIDGYFASALLSFVIGAMATFGELGRIPYHAFITQPPTACRARGRRRRDAQSAARRCCRGELRGRRG